MVFLSFLMVVKGGTPSRECGRKYSLRTSELSTHFPVWSIVKRDRKVVHNSVLE